MMEAALKRQCLVEVMVRSTVLVNPTKVHMRRPEIRLTLSGAQDLVGLVSVACPVRVTYTHGQHVGWRHVVGERRRTPDG
jgi:hypothetical protein